MSHRRVNRIAFSLGGVVALAVLSSVSMFWFIGKLYQPIHASRDMFQIVSGSSLRDVAFSLSSAGVIDDPMTFLLYGKLMGKEKTIQAGNYQLSPSLRVRDLLSLFAQGSNVGISVFLPEGLTLKESLLRMNSSGLLVDEEMFSSVPQILRVRYRFFSDIPHDASLEGFLFPDTYRFTTDTSSEQARDALLDNFNKKFNEEWYEKIAAQNHSIYETVIMASILEKEVRALEDKKVVAGLLWKRYELGMPLQVDATVNYATGKSLPAVTYEDLGVDSLYNTYMYAGLPPGPISNPGQDSLEASVFPESSEYWFYLSRQDTGETIFSKTLKEHNTAKAKYLR